MHHFGAPLFRVVVKGDEGNFSATLTSNNPAGSGSVLIVILSQPASDVPSWRFEDFLENKSVVFIIEDNPRPQILLRFLCCDTCSKLNY